MPNFSPTLRRWLVSYMVVLGWCGVLPIVILAAYYAARGDTSFDPALNRLVEGGRPRPTWLIRVGSLSQQWKNGAYTTSFFGPSASSPDSTRRAHLVFQSELRENHTATYLAMFPAQSFPVVLTAYRTTKLNGNQDFDIENNGVRPILSYAGFIAFGSVFCTAILELITGTKRRKRGGATAQSATPF